MDNVVVVMGLLFWPIIGIVYFLEKTFRQRSENKKFEQDFKRWLDYEEPKHRASKTYPPDWWNRKLYVHRQCDFKCQICGKTQYIGKKDLANAIKHRRHTMWTGLHVHHKLPLSKGGDNSFENLICLCARCHENQHPHMLKKLLADYRLKASRARSHESITHWNKLVADTEARLAQVNKNY